MNYTLETQFMQVKPQITIIGCGGTGGFVAEAVCRLFTGRKANIILIDHDRVEPHNLLRQNFLPEDTGKFKSDVLADRLVRSYDQIIGNSTARFEKKSKWDRAPGENHDPRLVIGCVDNAEAREAMQHYLNQHPSNWLIDAGNGRSWGQVLIGNASHPKYDPQRSFIGDKCLKLPAPTMQRPDILTAVDDVPPDIDCAAALDLVDQDPTINQMMAMLVVQVVRRMAANNCPWMSLYLDLEQGTMQPRYATPENVSQITGATVEKLTDINHRHYPTGEYDEDDEDYDENYDEDDEGGEE